MRLTLHRGTVPGRCRTVARTGTSRSAASRTVRSTVLAQGSHRQRHTQYCHHLDTTDAARHPSQEKYRTGVP